MSLAWPAVRLSWIGRPCASTRAWILVARPPRERPRQRSRPPFLRSHPVGGPARPWCRSSGRRDVSLRDDAAFDAATPVVPKFISPADPAARWTAAHGGQAFFAYLTNYLIDLKHAVIMDVEATTAVRQAEVGAARTMIGRTQDRIGTWPEKTWRATSPPLMPTSPRDANGRRSRCCLRT